MARIIFNLTTPATGMKIQSLSKCDVYDTVNSETPYDMPHLLPL